MSYKYNVYLTEHKANVKKALKWMHDNIPECINLILTEEEFYWVIEQHHDESKSEKLEYDAYDAYFYGGNRSYKVLKDFQYAWLMHIHCNPHHWQHWILYNDDPAEGEVVLEMPAIYVVEMVCDWWSFSWSKGDLSEIFTWYDERKNYIKLHPKTRKLVEKLLGCMQEKMDRKPD